MSSAVPKALRRLPLKEALTSLRTGEGSRQLSPAVKKIQFSFVAKNSESGPREFLRTYAPRIAYANPTLAFAVERIRDPRTKTVNPNNPNKGAEWENGEQPGSTMVVELESGPKTIQLSHLSAEQIYRELYDIAGPKSA